MLLSEHLGSGACLPVSTIGGLVHYAFDPISLQRLGQAQAGEHLHLNRAWTGHLERDNIARLKARRPPDRPWESHLSTREHLA
jgi:hypothetical protein